MKHILMIKKVIWPILFLIWTVPLSGQFQLNGSAIQTSDSCYQLTTTANFTVGSIWNLDKINLNESFDAVLQIFLGCKDGDGADGIVFGFQPVSTSIGGAGGGIGFANVSPSIGIEFDTYQNASINDPVYDHIAIIQDGNLNHGSITNLAGPIQASPDNPNIEDCEWHEIRVIWDADQQLLEIYLDCEFRLSYTGDIVTDIFGGDPEVFWGFTSATGGLNNTHQICLTYTTFLDQLDDLVLCPNGEVQLQATGGVSYEWSPPESLNNPASPSPIASPDSTTTYSVAIFDECGIPFFDSLTVVVDGDSSFVELGPDTTICVGDDFQLDASNPNSDYQWSTGDTTAQIDILQSGLYIVTVTVNDYCFDSDRVGVVIKPLPEAPLNDVPSICEDVGTTLETFFPDPDATFEWQDGQTTPSIQVFDEGLYSISVSNFCGTASSSVYLEVESCREVYIPNAFSPNDDGFNDYFFFQDAGDVVTIHYLRIFDRWGNLVYERTEFPTNDPRLGWDGRFRGQKMNAGVFLWTSELSFRNGERRAFHGDLTLVR
jgi:gliding motility-associated-like protein